MQEDNILLEWDAYEFKQKEKRPDWFWALGIIAVAGSTVSFIYGNFLFGVFIILATIALFFFGTAKPKRFTYMIMGEGIVVEDVLYPYKKIHAFWMEEIDGEGRLLLRTENKLVPVIVAPFEDEETGDQIHNILSQIMEEKPLREPIAHIIMDRLGF